VGLPIEAQSERSGRAAERAISIELVRALQHDASLAASGSERRLFVVSGAESLSLPAANALLKTIEEPPPHVVIVLTASDSYDLLPTIVSRCQLIRFALVPPAEIASGLVRLELATGERADLLSRLSGGRPGWAIAAAKSPDLLADRDKAIEDLSASTARSFRERLGLGEKLATTFSRDQGAIYQTLSLWQVWWWDVYLAQSGCSDLVTNVDRLDRIRDLARVVAPQRVVTYLGELNLASTRLAQNVNPRLALATLLLSSPNVDA
jgi:DNA polymerase-3 subunit delta'